MTYTLNLFSDNIKSILTIYEDSNKIREEKRDQSWEKIMEQSKFSQEEFDEFNLYDFHFEWILLHSLFISSYSYFENFMLSCAKQIQKKLNSKIEIKDIKGNGDIDSYRKYLNLIGEIEFADPTNEGWKKLMEFKAIRNSIIHKYGEINQNLSIIREHNIYFGPSQKMIRINNKSFLEDFSQSSIEYMSNLTKEINKKYYCS
ncbi:hypothetical protein E7Z59_10690 [Robertkochia marina]|uniref:RiboL-PSP-HEPN domain-containing protein n=1 Tax=Robertkochia marina TaxID=1227945 RepID=A0A4S3LXX2_9FLAO|nr:hypothetical protein [Robertkochia marina]THD66276.1 hypothetical protein E7Z59_10690 [Robertkochia marina]